MTAMTLYVVAIVALFGFLDAGQANYQLHVKVHSYSNLSLCSDNGSCCNCTSHHCQAQCNITLTHKYCPFYSKGLPAEAPFCPLGCQSLAENDGVQEVNRTLVFNGISWPGYLNLSIQVYQFPFQYNVEQFFLQNISVMVASNFTGVASYLGAHRNGHISLSFRVTCEPSSSGPSCHADCPDYGPCACNKKPCMNQGSCMPSLVTYRCVCLPGYTGSICQTPLMNSCNHLSHTISPSRGYNCSCANGFSGANFTNRIIHTAPATTAATIPMPTSSTSTSFMIVTSTAVATQPVTISAIAPVDFTSAANNIYTSDTDAINNINCTGAAACVPTSNSADVAKGQAVIAGVVVTLIVVVIVGAVTVAVFIIHKRSRKATDGLGTYDDTPRNNPTYDQNAVGVATLPLAAPPLEAVHNPVYSFSGIADAKESNVLVSDYDLPIMEYEVVKEREHDSVYTTLEQEAVYYGV